jgi:hypothetical protein
MSGIGGALKAIKKAILLEERVTSQTEKLEKLVLNVVEMDKRLAVLERSRRINYRLTIYSLNVTLLAVLSD